MENQIVASYIQTEKGEILAQIPDASSRAGFTIFSEEETWDGGEGLETNWKLIPASAVPPEARERLFWVFDEHGLTPYGAED